MESNTEITVTVETATFASTQDSLPDQVVAEINVGFQRMGGLQNESEKIEVNQRSSSGSEEESSSPKELPTFTNEVIIIRPQTFYENVEAQSDNKFMKNSGL